MLWALRKEIYSGTPRATEALRIIRFYAAFGLGCLAIGSALLPGDTFILDIFNSKRSQYASFLLAGPCVLVLLLVLGMKGIERGRLWSRNILQLTILYAISILIIFLFTFHEIDFIGTQIVLMLAVFIVLLIKAPHIYLVLRYLGRLAPDGLVHLPEHSDATMTSNLSNSTLQPSPAINPSHPPYMHVHPNFSPKNILILSGMLALITLMINLFPTGNDIDLIIKWKFIPLALLIGGALFFFGYVVAIRANWKPSPFENGRERVHKFYCGIQAPFFYASLPFVLLIIYKDGIEIRCFYHYFFVPFEKMEVVEVQQGLAPFTLIKSELPWVPSRVLFISAASRKSLKTVIQEAKLLHLGENHSG